MAQYSGFSAPTKLWHIFVAFLLLFGVSSTIDGFSFLRDRPFTARKERSRSEYDRPMFVDSPTRRSSQIHGASDDGLVTSSCSPASSVSASAVVDPYESFPLFDKILFKLFAASVTAEMEKRSKDEPKNYGELMDLINEMTKTRSSQRVNDQGKNMLKRLFPPWLLTQYKWMFAAPFPEFSAWMNAYVTHWTTNWLMGKSTVYDLEYENSSGKKIVKEQQGLLIEKCRFLESAGCAKTCLHACKIPTQRFFLEEMGLPVTLLPNMTDFSCKFEFGIMPPALEDDPISKTPCLAVCSLNLRKSECLS